MDNYTTASYPIGNCNSSYSPKLVSTNGQYWRCYMRDTKGNVFATQKVYINTNSSARIGGYLNSVVYPNPTNENFENIISFEIKEQSKVKLELVDQSGEVIQLITENIHNIGSYNYPFTLKNKRFNNFKIVYYRLAINDIAETKRIVVE
jgi:hypothetical protein